jgi:alpha,alpha-trehalose phosphorylase
VGVAGPLRLEHGFRIDGVTGPDEYTAVVDNNVYTNLMAQRNLREACRGGEAQPDVPAG